MQETLLEEEITLGIDARFSGAEYSPFIKEIPICSIGCGGIGSPFHLIISRMNPKIILNYEFDDVEIHNLGGQIFNMDDIGNLKSEATANRLKNYSDFHNFIQLGKFERDSQVSPVMILCVDNNATRMEAALKWREQGIANNWEFEVMVKGEIYKFPYMMLDGRLSFNNFDTYVVTSHEIDYHIEHRLPLNVGDVLPPNCTTKSNPEVGTLTAMFMITLYRNWVQNIINKNDGFPETKATPYRFNGNLSNFKFKTYELTKA